LVFAHVLISASFFSPEEAGTTHASTVPPPRQCHVACVICGMQSMLLAGIYVQAPFSIAFLSCPFLQVNRCFLIKTMRFISLALFLASITIIQGVAVPYTHVLHEKRDAAVLKRWVQREKLDSSTILPMRIGLTQKNLDHGHEFLMEV
jgi:Pro-kumamolisin, activation domain